MQTSTTKQTQTATCNMAKDARRFWHDLPPRAWPSQIGLNMALAARSIFFRGHLDGIYIPNARYNEARWRLQHKRQTEKIQKLEREYLAHRREVKKFEEQIRTIRTGMEEYLLFVKDANGKCDDTEKERLRNALKTNVDEWVRLAQADVGNGAEGTSHQGRDAASIKEDPMAEKLSELARILHDFAGGRISEGEFTEWLRAVHKEVEAIAGTDMDYDLNEMRRKAPAIRAAQARLEVIEKKMGLLRAQREREGKGDQLLLAGDDSIVEDAGSEARRNGGGKLGGTAMGANEA